eukprot:COSAG06_NODE_4365_length_4328_cov_12.154410_1_plen_103_part_10
MAAGVLEPAPCWQCFATRLGSQIGTWEFERTRLWLGPISPLVQDEGVEGAAAGSTAAAADSKPSSSEEEEDEGGDEIMELSHPMGRLKSVEELKAESAVPTRQ